MDRTFVFLLFVSTISLSYAKEKEISSDSICREVFTIQEGVNFVGLEEDDYIILNKQNKVYVLPNTTFIAHEQLFVNIIIIESKNKKIINELSNLQAKIDLIPQKEERRGNIDLLQVNPIPFNGKHSGFYFFAYLDCNIVPASSNQYTDVFIEDLLSFFTNKSIIKNKDQNFVYHQFIKAFVLNILLQNKSPPVLYC